MLNSIKYIVLTTIVIILTTSCGFKPIDKSQIFNFKLESFETSGDKKLNFYIKNDLMKFFNISEGNEKIILKINTLKKKEIKDKNSKNVITKYQITITTTVMINELISNTKRNFSVNVKGGYNVSDNHTTTINNQNKLEKDLSLKIGDLIIKELILKINDN